MELISVLLFLIFVYALILTQRVRKEKKRFESKGIFYMGSGAIKAIKNFVRNIGVIEDELFWYKKLKGEGYRLGGGGDLGITTLFVVDPALIKSAMVKDFDYFVDRRRFDVTNHDYLMKKMLFAKRGDDWRVLRNKLSPAFTSGKIRHLVQLFNHSAEKMVKFFNEKAIENGGIVELDDGYFKYSMDVIASAVCGIDSQTFENKEIGKFEKMARLSHLDFGGMRILKIFLMTASKRLSDILGLSMFEKEMQDFFSKTLKSTISKRTENEGSKIRDFLQLMLDAREGILKAENRETDDFTTKSSGKLSNISDLLDDEGIVANAVMFILVGFDTTQSLLLFAPYLLSLNPEVQEKLRVEICSAMLENDGELTYDTIMGMTYLDMVVCETLRMYPPVPATDRGCVKDYHVPGTDFVLQKNEGIFIPIYAIHHDPEYYPDPEKFDPERFSPENRKNISPNCYLPFGQGPRGCIGMRFALTKAKIAICHLIKNFNIEPCKQTMIPMKLSKSAFLKPEKALAVKLSKIDA